MTFPLLMTWLDAKSCTWGGSASRVQAAEPPTVRVTASAMTRGRGKLNRYNGSSQVMHLGRTFACYNGWTWTPEHRPSW
ncbi:hypothetical protein, partial [Geitlerinema sp. P-1104]|uniref:hypothetical protein n=1 Tax=Geitlerinema sp. P-1104 TaxID=2546230 RepID=UPI00197E2464